MFFAGFRFFQISSYVVMPKKHARKEAFWEVEKFKIISRKPAANGAIEIIVVSRVYVTTSCTIVLSYQPSR